jgi:hypothetical protein
MDPETSYQERREIMDRTTKLSADLRRDLSLRSADVKRQLTHAAETRNHFSQLIKSSDVLKQMNSDVENLVVCLKCDFFSINQKIEDIGQTRSSPPSFQSCEKLSS